MKHLVNFLQIISVMLFVSILPVCSVVAADNTDDEEIVKNSGHSDGGNIYLGFRWFDADNVSRLGQYEEDDEFSPVLGLEFENYPLPNRYFIHSEYLSSNNFYGDVGYAYSDIVMLRNVLVGIHHNLDHYSYDHAGDPPGVTYLDRNVGDEYFVDFLKNDLYLRFKAPNFPLHTFIKHNYVKRDGSIQERFLIGYFGSLDKRAETRDIDWQANDLTLGINSHLGPIEVEYAHNQFEFDPGSGSVLYDFFRTGRPPDTYPHNVVPETESYANSLKLHTSYTGQIVASATLSNEESTNNYSGAESDAWKGAFDLQWLPDPVISLFFRYRHATVDKESPETMTLYGARSRVAYEVRKPVSTAKDLLSFSARYRPLGKLTLNGTYEYEMLHRDDVEDWHVLPESTDVHRVKLTARTRIFRTLKLKGTYQYQNYDNPAYNKQPDQFNKLMLNASFAPASWITALLDYSITLTQRDDLLYLNGTDVVEGGERDGRTDRALASMSFLLNQDTSLTASWAYNRWKTEQDTAYSQWDSARPGSITALPYYDRGAQYTDDVHTFAFSLYAKLRKDLKLKTGLSYSIAESEYEPNPSYLTVFTSRKSRETTAKVELTQKIMEDWEIGIYCKAGWYDDEYSNPVFDEDGDLYSTTLTLKRYF